MQIFYLSEILEVVVRTPERMNPSDGVPKEMSTWVNPLVNLISDFLLLSCSHSIQRKCEAHESMKGFFRLISSLFLSEGERPSIIWNVSESEVDTCFSTIPVPKAKKILLPSH